MLTLNATISSSAAIAASLASITVVARSGSGPSTIASRRSNASASHITAAITPIATIAYMMKIVAISRVSGSSSAGKRIAAASNALFIWIGISSAGVRMKASGPTIARCSCISEVTVSLAKNCAKNARASTSNREPRILGLHRRDQAAGALFDVFLRDQRCKHCVERRQAQGVAQIRNRVVSDDPPVLEDDDPRADLLDDLEHVRAEHD